MKESGGVTSFDNMPVEKPDFLAWRAQNSQGYVLNELSKTHFMLHQADCGSLDDIGPDALANPKHCADKEDPLLLLAKGAPDRCPNCYG